MTMTTSQAIICMDKKDIRLIDLKAGDALQVLDVTNHKIYDGKLYEIEHYYNGTAIWFSYRITCNVEGKEMKVGFRVEMDDKYAVRVNSIGIDWIVTASVENNKQRVVDVLRKEWLELENKIKSQQKYSDKLSKTLDFLGHGTTH